MMTSDPLKELRKPNSSGALPSTLLTSCSNTSLTKLAGLNSKALTPTASSARRGVPAHCGTGPQLCKFCKVTFLRTVGLLTLPVL